VQRSTSRIPESARGFSSFVREGRAEKWFAAMESEALHALPQERKRAKTKGATTMRRRFKADPKWITVRHPARCAEPNCQTKSTPANAASITPAISRFTALAEGMAKARSVIFGTHRINEDGY
jgi:hypothetical protein